jgi:membrane-associated phospholipid phosphatase
MKNRSFQLAIVALAFAACAVAQDASGDRVCTDLSGKVRLPCPQEKQQDPAAKPVGQETIERGQPESQAPTLPAGASAGHVPSSTNSVYDGTPAPPATRVTQNGQPYRSLERSFVRNFVADQKGFWTSPLKLRVEDAQWVVPLVGAMTVVTLSDGSIERKLPTNASFIKQSKTFSDYGVVTYAGAVASAYLWSRATHNDHMRETAVLSGEAAANSLLITEGIKYIAGRNRPLENDGTGRFLNGGSSFPSGHSSTAWAIASVIAREYPGPLTQLLAYGGAAAISATRVTGRQHFTSDVLVGGAIGWFVGRQVYNAHHDRNNPDLAYGTFERDRSAERPRDPEHMGSPYVPLDSWIYPAMDRLAALGYIQSAFLGLRPWTRMECARLLEEAGTKLQSDSAESPAAQRLFESLRDEFAFENKRWTGERNLGAEVESIYTRITGISGKPLNDGYHFGQTIINDFGRPYQEGFNAIVGASGYAVAGPFAFYVRAEYQHSPFAPALTSSVRNTIATLDLLPVAPAAPFAEVNRMRLLDAYAAVNLSGWQLSFGQQSLWWGTGRGGSLMFSDNAEPATLIRFSRMTPMVLPGIGRLLGPIKTESFFGQLQGHRFVFQAPSYLQLTGSYGHFLDPQPFIHGEKFTLKPTPNLEIGVSITALLSGPGVPLTFSNFLHTFSPHGAGQKRDPGDRRTGFEFSYRIPGLRNWLTLYNESLAEDEPNPIAYPRRSAMNPGIYLAHVPGLPNLDLRVESAYTDLPGLTTTGTYYTNVRFRDGYTNNGNIMGSWVGRQGRGVQASSTYWFGPQKKITVGYRYANVSPGFVPNGGTLNDFNAAADWSLQGRVSISSMVQWERWNFPVLAGTSQGNISASVQVSYHPKLH